MKNTFLFLFNIILFLSLVGCTVPFEPDIKPLEISTGNDNPEPFAGEIRTGQVKGASTDKESEEKAKEKVALEKLARNRLEGKGCLFEPVEHFEWRVRQEMAYLEFAGAEFDSNIMPEDPFNSGIRVTENFFNTLFNWTWYKRDKWREKNPEPYYFFGASCS